MYRVTHLLLGVFLVLGGCVTGPIPQSEESPQQPKTSSSKKQQPSVHFPTPSASSCLEGGPPDWANQSGRYVAVRKSSTQEDADSAARLAVLKELEVKITGTDTILQHESKEKGYQYSIHSEVVERVDLVVSGLEINHRAYAPCKEQYYALARLDQAQAIHAWEVDLRSLAGQAQNLEKQSQNLVDQGQIFSAIAEMSGLLKITETCAQIARRVAYLSRQAESQECSFGKVDQVRSMRDSLLNSIQLRRVSGDHQRATIDSSMPEPFVVRVLAGDRPISNVHIRFSVKEGDIKIETKAVTDSQGEARASGHYLAPSEKASQVMAQIAIEETAHGFPDNLAPKGQQWSVGFAVFPPVYHKVRELENLAQQAEQLRTNAIYLFNEGRIFEPITALYKRAEVQADWAKTAKILKGFGLPGIFEKIDDPGDAAKTQAHLKAILDSITLEKKGGDNQAAQLKRPLEEALTVQVVAELPAGNAPIPDMPVQFEFEAGQGKMISTRVETDKSGQAETEVTQVEPAENKAVIVAKMMLDQLPPDFPKPLQKQLQDRFQPVRFTVTPPWACQASHSFDDTLFKLACELATKADESVESDIVVEDFIFDKTRQSVPFSSQLERKIADGLVLTGVFHVLEKTDTSAITRGENFPEGSFVRGEFGLDPENGVWVIARLMRHIGQGEVVNEWTTARKIIPLRALSENTIKSISPQLAPESVNTPVPNVTLNQTFDDWVEQFWGVTNPSASFRIELMSEKPQYQVGEKAKFLVKTERDCYLSVINIGVSGKWTLLVPNPYRPDSIDTLIRKRDGWIKIPDTLDNFEFTVSLPVGTERVKAICTLQPVQLVENMELSQGFFQLSKSDLPRFRDINVTPKKGDWTQATAQILTLRKGQTETRGEKKMRSRGLVIGQ